MNSDASELAHSARKPSGPHIIALVNEKGGAGKSTIAINLACAMHRAGRRVAIIDTDPQGTARNWRERTPEDVSVPPVIVLDRPEGLVQGIQMINADVIVVDTPAKAERMTANVIRLAHTALIPVQPSGADLWAVDAVVRQIHMKRDAGGLIDVAFISNRLISGAKLSREMSQGEWNQYTDIPLMENGIASRTSYGVAMTAGVSVYDTKDTAAKAEIDHIVAELEAVKWL